MKEYEEKLKRYMTESGIDAEQIKYAKTCHSVAEAAEAAHASPEDFVKNICMLDASGSLIVGIVKGEDRASTTRVAKALNIEAPRVANPDEILEKTGYICGGVPSFGYEALFLIDPKVMERTYVYTGGGSPYSLTRISTQALQQANQGRIVRIRK